MCVTTELIVNNFERSASNERNPKTSRLQEYFIPYKSANPGLAPKYAECVVEEMCWLEYGLFTVRFPS